MLPLLDISSELSVLIFAVGLLFSLVAYLLTNVSPGGFVVPSALVVSAIESPASLLMIGGVTILSWAIMKTIERFTILYGKRLFALTLLTSTMLGTGAFYSMHTSYPTLFPGDALGFLIPGLIVYQLMRQQAKATLAVTGVVIAATGSVALLVLAV